MKPIDRILGDQDLARSTRPAKEAIKDPLIKHRYNHPRAAQAVRVVSKSAYDRLIFHTLGIRQGCRARTLKVSLGKLYTHANAYSSRPRYIVSHFHIDKFVNLNFSLREIQSHSKIFGMLWSLDSRNPKIFEDTFYVIVRRRSLFRLKFKFIMEIFSWRFWIVLQQ